MSLTVATVGEFLDHGYQLDAHCGRCGRHGPVDLAALPAGAELTGDRRRRLRCSACGSIDVARTVVAPTWWSRRRVSANSS